MAIHVSLFPRKQSNGEGRCGSQIRDLTQKIDSLLGKEFDPLVQSTTPRPLLASREDGAGSIQDESMLPSETGTDWSSTHQFSADDSQDSQPSGQRIPFIQAQGLVSDDAEVTLQATFRRKASPTFHADEVLQRGNSPELHPAFCGLEVLLRGWAKLQRTIEGVDRGATEIVNPTDLDPISG